VDLLSSLAELVGSEVRSSDSEELMKTFLGEQARGRSELIIEATGRTALRKGDWVFIPPHNGRAIATEVNIELGNDEKSQLYHLDEDIGEQQNLAQSNPAKLKEMTETFEQMRGVTGDVNDKLELK
jgi:arylsulfatase A-like enzyme